MDKRKDNGISLVFNKGVKYEAEENFVKNPAMDSSISPLNMESLSNTERGTEVDIVKKETELYNSVYKEISEIVGLDATLKIYLRFKGQQISFPVRLYNPNMIQQLEHWNLKKHNYMRAVIDGKKIEADDHAYDKDFRMINYIGVNGRTFSIRTLSLWVEALEDTEVLHKNYAIDDFEYLGEHSRPAVTVCKCGKGKIASIWFNMGYSYIHNRSFVMRDMMAELVNALDGTDLWIEGSHFIHAALREKDGRTMVQLLNTGTQGFTPLYAYDEIVPVYNIKVKLKCSQCPTAAYLQPDGTEISFSMKDGIVTFDIPIVRIHEILEIVW